MQDPFFILDFRESFGIRLDMPIDIPVGSSLILRIKRVIKNVITTIRIWNFILRIS